MSECHSLHINVTEIIIIIITEVKSVINTCFSNLDNDFVTIIYKLLKKSLEI